MAGAVGAGDAGEQVKRAEAVFGGAGVSTVQVGRSRRVTALLAGAAIVFWRELVSQQESGRLTP